MVIYDRMRAKLASLRTTIRLIQYCAAHQITICLVINGAGSLSRPPVIDQNDIYGASMDILASRIAFVDQLAKINRKLRTLFDARIKTHGLTLARARLLMHLAKEEGATQTELADALEVEQPSIVGLIDGLEQKGFVTRRAVEGDRRAKGIFLTESARGEADAILNFVNELREQALGGVNQRDLMIATRVLNHLARNIGAAS